MSERRRVSIAVRALVEHACRSGDLDRPAGLGPAGPRAGQRAAAAVRRCRGAGYVAEVPLSTVVVGDDLELEIVGRADGVWQDGEWRVVEEIKATTAPPLFLGANRDPLHAAQAELYAAMLARCEDRSEVAVDLTYVRVPGLQMRSSREVFTRQRLEQRLLDAARFHLSWLELIEKHKVGRDASLVGLRPPYGAFRPGQRELARAVFAAANRDVRLLAQAPTGSGKTAGVLYGALAALGHGLVEQVVFLTAKTSGRAAPEAELERMRADGARMTSVTLTAREQTCVGDGSCRAAQCPRAAGGWDRWPEARRALWEIGLANRLAVERIAAAHLVCPHLLGMSLVPWVDVVLGDYGYVFDPRVALASLTAPRRRLVVVDEAHNLVERGRVMWSAALSPGSIAAAARQLGSGRRGLRRSAARLARTLEEVRAASVPRASIDTAGSLHKGLVRAVKSFLDQAEAAFAEAPGQGVSDALVEVFFEGRSFLRLLESPAPHDRLIGTAAQLTVFCSDPAPRLGTILDEASSSAVLLSATLSPVEYYHRCLGCRSQDPSFSLPSPFSPNRFSVLVADQLSTRLADRATSAPQVAALIAAAVSARPGSYLAFFPSYEYLETVAPLLAKQSPQLELAAQRRGATAAQTEEFLAYLGPRDERSFVGLAVLGGTFSEAVNLPGDRLLGVVIVGLGLPPPDPRREAIREAFEASDGAGSDYAYLFPALTKIVQAAGRVIRSETDKGFALLVDDRFSRSRIRRLLFPALPQTAQIGTCDEVVRLLSVFWSGL